MGQTILLEREMPQWGRSRGPGRRHRAGAPRPVPRTAMEPSREDWVDACAGARELSDALASMELSREDQVDRFATEVRRPITRPQWSPVAETRSTGRHQRPVRVAAGSAMEPSRGYRVDVVDWDQ